ncbi:hypothetical protein TNCV_3148391 [Trichonephila clavipes]|nr:hypothetical protein TNCV_3148391 [Trichonephila clavipes]
MSWNRGSYTGCDRRPMSYALETKLAARGSFASRHPNEIEVSFQLTKMNSFLLYKNVVGKRITFLEFQIQVVEEILHKYDDSASRQKKPEKPHTVGIPARLTEYDILYSIFLLPLRNISVGTVFQQLILQCQCSSLQRLLLKKVSKWKKRYGRKHDSGVKYCEVALRLEEYFRFYQTKLNY